MNRFTLALFALAVGGVLSAHAYSTDDLKSAGWTQVTDLSDVSNNFYVFVDAGASATFMVRGAAATDRPRYTTLANPQENPDGVWVLEANGSNYAIKGIKDGYYFNSNTNGWQDNLAATNTTGNFTFTVAEGKYSITNTGVTSYNSSSEGQSVGPWNGSGAVSLTDGYENIAVNKRSDLAPGFYIFAMPRATYLANASSDSPIVVTGILGHSTISDATPTGWTLTRDGGATPAYGSNLFEVWNANSFTLEQTATVPSGEYTIGVNGFYRAGDGGTTTSTQNLYLFGNTSEGAVASINSAAYATQPSVTNATWSNVDGVGYVPNNMVAADYAIHTDSKYANTLSGVVVSDGSLNLGLKRTAHIDADWSIFNNFSLACTKLYIDGAALTYTDGATLAADTWYVYNVLYAGTYTLSATDGIVYTQNGSQGVNDEITSKSASSTITLTAGKLYVKSSTAQALTITPASYTYNIGEATINVKDGEYIQSPTIKVTFPNATTDNTASTLALTSGATATVNNASVSLSAIDNGFSLDLGTLAANTDYSVTIPANVYGYDGQSMNSEITLTLKTPAVFDGYYYLKTLDNKYLSRGGRYGTEAIADSYGLPLKVTTNGNGITEFVFVDNNFHLFDANDANLFTDNNTANNFSVEVTDGGYYVVNKNTTANSSYDGKLYINDASTVTISSESATVWTFEDATTTAHKTQMQAVKDAQAAAVATTAGISATTVDGLTSKLASDYGATSISITGTGGAIKENYQGGASSDYNSVPLAVFAEDTISNLKPGLYCLSVNAFERITWNDDTYNAGGAPGLTYVYANDEKVQLASVFDVASDTQWNSGDYKAANGKYYPNNTTGAQAAFDAGNYTNKVYVYVTADDGSETGSIKFGIKKPNRYGNDGSRGAWVCYNNFTLTYYEAKATEAEKTALSDAITAAESKLGFEAGEYAPYNNVDAIKALAAAKAINTETASGVEVTAATAAIASDKWTANTEEVNAIAGGDSLDSYTNNGTYDLPNGWSNVGFKTRILGISESLASDNPGLAGTTKGRAILVKFNTSYGDTIGYTLPLKASTTYKFSFTYGLWNEGGTITKGLTVTTPNGAEIAMTPSTVSKNEGSTDNCANKVTTAWYTYEAYFTTTDAGNYVLNITNPDGDNQRQMVFADLVLKKAVASDITLDDAETAAPSLAYGNVTLDRTFATGWNSIVLPFATTTTELGAAEAAAYQGTDDTTIKFESTQTLKANTPYIVYFASAPTSIKFSEAKLVNPSGNLTVEDAGTTKQYNFVGTYTAYTTSETSPIAKGDYYVVSTGIQRAAGGNTFKAFRAYFDAQSTTAAAKRMVLSIDGDVVTAIDGVSVDSLADDDAPAYNLAGQRVGKSYKGVVVKNGKKLIRK